VKEYAAAQGFTGQIAHWDVTFWAERLREAKYSITDEELRPYFALPNVLEGLFGVRGPCMAWRAGSICRAWRRVCFWRAGPLALGGGGVCVFPSGLLAAPRFGFGHPQQQIMMCWAGGRMLLMYHCWSHLTGLGYVNLWWICQYLGVRAAY
jgi:Peptidase family M3